MTIGDAPQIASACKTCVWGSGALLTYITWFITAFLGGLIIWFFKRGFTNSDRSIMEVKKEMNARFDKVDLHFSKIEEQQSKHTEMYHLCRTALPNIFASREALKEWSSRVSSNEKDLASIKKDIENIHKKINGCN